MNNSKNCKICNIEKNIEEFTKDYKKTTNGEKKCYYRNTCKICYCNQLKKYYISNKDKYIENAKIWNKTHYKSTGNPIGRPKKEIDINIE